MDANDFVEYFEVKNGPDIVRKQCPSFLIKSVDEENRTITAMASTGSIDRDGEIIEPNAFRSSLKGYMENPVVLAAHQHRLADGRSPVVANVVACKITKAGVLVTVKFHCETELSKEYWGLYKSKSQRAFSVGFRSVKGEPRTIDGQRVYVHTEIEWYELSCVAVGSNRDALSKSKQGKRDFVDRKRQARGGGTSYADMINYKSETVTDWSGKAVSQEELDARAVEYGELVSSASPGCEIAEDPTDEYYIRSCVDTVERWVETSEKAREAVENMLAEFGYDGEDGETYEDVCVKIVRAVRRSEKKRTGKPFRQKRKRNVAEAVGVGGGGRFEGYFK